MLLEPSKNCDAIPSAILPLTLQCRNRFLQAFFAFTPEFNRFFLFKYLNALKYAMDEFYYYRFAVHTHTRAAAHMCYLSKCQQQLHVNNKRCLNCLTVLNLVFKCFLLLFPINTGNVINSYLARKMSAIDYLKKAVEYDMNGRKLESLKLYQSGISALLEICKGMLY